FAFAFAFASPGLAFAFAFAFASPGLAFASPGFLAGSAAVGSGRAGPSPRGSARAGSARAPRSRITDAARMPESYTRPPASRRPTSFPLRLRQDLGHRRVGLAAVPAEARLLEPDRVQRGQVGARHGLAGSADVDAAAQPAAGAAGENDRQLAHAVPVALAVLAEAEHARAVEQRPAARVGGRGQDVEEAGEALH